MATLDRLVLIVDDDDDWRAVMADVLAAAGFIVTTAADGRAACACWQRARADVVVTDVRMPRMDGCQLLATLHSMDRTLPVIVLSAEDASDMEATFSEAFRVIRKPAPVDAVVSAVKEALVDHRVPRLRRIASRARAAAFLGRHQAAALSRAASFLRPSKTADSASALTGPRRVRGRLAVVAGFGAAAAVVVVIAAIRGFAA
jgi:DNA-binding NtrC family response regulator